MIGIVTIIAKKLEKSLATIGREVIHVRVPNYQQKFGKRNFIQFQFNNSLKSRFLAIVGPLVVGRQLCLEC